MRARVLLVLLTFAVVAIAIRPVAAAPFGTAFGYQGRLLRNGIPIQGITDFRYTLWDDVSAGAQTGPAVTNLGMAVTDGLVSTTLDFGPVFDGNRRWVQVEVKGAADPAFVLLTPRQEILPVPYAMWSGAGGSSLQLPFLGVLPAGIPLFEVRNSMLSSTAAGIRAQTQAGIAVEGLTSQGNKDAILGTRVGDGFNAAGVHGDGQQFSMGVSGTAQLAPGVFGYSQSSYGVRGGTGAGANVAGVYGENIQPHPSGSGVEGYASSLANGVYGHSLGGYGVLGTTAISSKAGVKGTTDNSGAYGGWFENTASGGVALYANGEVQVGVLTILGGADLAERFETAEQVEPGTVLVIDPDSPGRLKVSTEPYARGVAGVVSGANALPAGVVLGRDPEPGQSLPVALSGRVWVRCDASRASIRPGDLLTTATRPGCAMKASDPSRATGAILGKAMSPLKTGNGLVLVLVSLQ